MRCFVVGTNGCLDLRRRASALGWRVSPDWSRWLGSMVRCARGSAAPLQRSPVDWMPARIGKLSVGGGHRHPVTNRKASLMAGSLRRIYEHCGTRQEHSTLLLNGPGQGWLFAAFLLQRPRPEPASRLRSAKRDVSFLRSHARCRRYMSDCPTLLRRGIWIRSRRTGICCWGWLLAHVWPGGELFPSEQHLKVLANANSINAVIFNPFMHPFCSPS